MEKKARRRLLGIIFLLIACTMLVNRTRVWIDAVYLSLIPMTLCAFRLLLTGADKSLCKEPISLRIRRAIVCALLTLVWLLMLSVWEMRASNLFSRDFLMDVYADVPRLGRFYYYYQRFCYLPGICIGIWLLLYDCLSCCTSDKTPQQEPVLFEKDRKRLVFCCWLCIAALTAFSVLCVYPFYPVSDTLLVKRFIDNGEWNAWHTMGYLFFAYLTSFGGANYFFVVIAQGCCWAYANYTALSFLSTQPRGACGVRAYTALSLVSFLPYLYCGIMYKDSLFTACMLGFCVVLTEMFSTENVHNSVYVRLALFGLGTALFRHGAFPVVLAALIALCIRTWQRNRKQLLRAGLVTAAFLCGCLGVNRLLPRLLHATASPDYVMYTVPMGMIGAVAKSGVPLDPDELTLIEQIMPYAEWAEAYDPYFMDPLSRTDAQIGERVLRIDELHLGPSLLWLNAKFLFRHPRIYLTAFFNANSIMWEMGRPDDGRAAEWNWMLNFARKPAELPDGGMTVNTGCAPIMVSIADFTYQNPIYRCLVWRGGSSLFVLLLCAVALLFMGRAELLIASLVPLAYSGMLLLSIPSQDPRYVLPATVTAVFFGTFIFLSSNRNRRSAQTYARTENCEIGGK